jgi:predicted RNA-binding protein YlqC (UPF0109 family)
MQAFLEFVVRNLVDYPEEVVVSVRPLPGKTAYDLRVHRSDVGKLVGKSGQTIDAIRALVTVAGAKMGQRFQVEIVEEARRTPVVPPGKEGENPPMPGAGNPHPDSDGTDVSAHKTDGV